MVEPSGRKEPVPTEIWRDEVGQIVAGGTALVEVLPAEEYEAEHLPGAINISLPQLNFLPVPQLKRQEVVPLDQSFAGPAAGKLS